MNRKDTKTIYVRGVPIGGGHPIPVQSMTNTHTEDVEATLEQIRRLEEAGCQIVRLAVPHLLAARALKDIRRGTDMPLVADIHFDYKLALAAVEAGFDKIRINPGNIGSPQRVKAVADACRERGIPIRIGVNGGSLEKEILERYGWSAEGMCRSALRHAGMLEQCGFHDICISLKASDPALTVEANRRMSELCDYPLHVGVTEAGTTELGVLRSAAGIGSLLLDGIGDTIRVSLTDDPVEEVKAGIKLLKALNLRGGVHFVSCPSCGRTEYDLFGTARAVEQRLKDKNWDITVAVMGCVVNGPGEASHADYGIAGGKKEGVIFKKGVPVARVAVAELAEHLVALIESENS
ncbi:MAG: flavodoxin-dependent (E)-4-hydroxy-3-methylbut-2-enyl-diphosphate synthase [Oscillospiraceae bacterium]|nr:flavodoxin-dependent (E)-4-hydroxy-3-methylbut-2-enyl-diphosphate synthase [bacterium]MDY5100626.1 flavodoxin-dependent (E)-4-hydroxy-3-methylbut-2-enyl-diphosphate synthase [Oscillospiraceae bacterium]